MRLDVTTAMQRRRLAADLARQPLTQPASAPAAPLRPQDAQPSREQPAAQLVQWAQAALSVVLGLRLQLHGELDATTRTALRKFQGQRGLAVTGALDTGTVTALAQALGQPVPGAAAEHTRAPRWFRLDRPPAAGRAPAPTGALPPGRAARPRRQPTTAAAGKALDPAETEDAPAAAKEVAP